MACLKKISMTGTFGGNSLSIRYIVFDVETPNRYNNRISAIGITVIEDGKIIDNYFSLVDPEQPFDWFNSKLTGINEENCGIRSSLSFHPASSSPTTPALISAFSGNAWPAMESIGNHMSKESAP